MTTPKPPDLDKTTRILVIKIVGGLTLICILGVAQEAVITGDPVAIAGMTNIGMLGLGALATLIGYRQEK